MASLWPAKSAKGSCPISSRPRRRGRSSSSRMRIGRQSSPRFLKYGHGELPTHRREVVQKNFQCVACFEMVKQGLDWYASTAKHRGSAVNLGVNGDQLSVHGDSTKSSRRVVYFRAIFFMPSVVANWGQPHAATMHACERKLGVTHHIPNRIVRSLGPQHLVDATQKDGGHVRSRSFARTVSRRAG